MFSIIKLLVKIVYFLQCLFLKVGTSLGARRGLLLRGGDVLVVRGDGGFVELGEEGLVVGGEGVARGGEGGGEELGVVVGVGLVGVAGV